MTKYMVLFKADQAATKLMTQASPKQIQASMAAWTEWKDSLDKAIDFEWGLPMQIVAEVTSSEIRDGESPISGYAIMHGDKQAITTVLQSHPHLKHSGTSIDVLEMFPVG